MNDLVSPEEIAPNELSNADCLQLVARSSLTQVFSQLSFWEKECQNDSHTSSSKFKAAALWHDLRQLLATKPGLSWGRNDLPEFLGSCFHFTQEITALVKRYLERAPQIQGGRSVPVQHGPWQGGSSDFSQSCSQFETLCHFRIASLNMGALVNLTS